MIHAVRYDAGGVALDSYGGAKRIDAFEDYVDSAESVMLVAAADRTADPSLRTFYLAWRYMAEDEHGTEQQHIRGLRIRAALGRVVDYGGTLVPSTAGRPDEPQLVSSGTDCYLVWQQDGPWVQGGNHDIFGARVSSDTGGLIGSPAALSNTMFDEYEPTSAFDGRHFWVGFLGSANQKPGAAVSRVDDQGVLLDTPSVGGAEVLINGTRTEGFRLAGNSAGRVLAAYVQAQDVPHGVPRVLVRMLESTDAELDGGFAMPEAAADSAPDVADTGSPDVTSPDVTSPDGDVEAEIPDSGEQDTLVSPDTGEDASGQDASADASEPDGSTPPVEGGDDGNGVDGSAGTAGSSVENDGGCGCGVPRSTRSGVAGLLGALLLLARLRRRTSIVAPSAHRSVRW